MKISMYIFRNILIFTVLLLIIITILDCTQNYIYFLNDSTQMRIDYINQRKDRIKEEVTQAKIVIDMQKKIHSYDEEKIAKQHIALILESLRSPDVGYLFATSFEGVAIIGPNKGKNSINIRDVNGKYVVKELIKTAKAGGGFVEYVMPAIEGVRSAAKISYVLPILDWKWYIGAGVYIDDIENQIKIKQNKVIAQTIHVTLSNILIALFMIVVVIFTNKEIANKIKNSVERFNTFFMNTLEGNSKIELENAPFEEFIMIAEGANCLLERRLDLEQALRDGEAKYKELAYNDMLTGLPNRIYYREYLEKYFVNCGDSCCATIIYIDLDNFKHVNSFIGQETGDVVLIDVANRLAQINGVQKTICRITADEFAIIIKDEINFEDLEQLLLNITNIFDKNFVVGENEFDIKASIGVSKMTESHGSAYELLKNAEIAMNEAKKNGKNQIVFYNNNLYENIHRKILISNRFKEAYENDRFVLYYQPQVDIENNRIMGLEALIRWKDPEHGMISPMEFIPIAEESGHIKTIGEWVFKKACIFAKEINEGRENPIIVSVNFSPKQFLNFDVFENIKEIIDATGVNARHIAIEITESSIIESLEECTLKLKNLQSIGLLTYLDDFGTGYSALNLLRRLPICGLKVDKSFIYGMENDLKMQEILSKIIEIAKVLELDIVSEGVETKEQMEIIQKMGCKYIQGYYFHKPMPEDEVKKLLDNITIS
jgi:diguanylate cyclase (GGDEF)-like protein